MELTGMPVTAEGDLLWSDEHARPGEPAEAFATARVALPTATAPVTAPLDRHPARIAVPVFLEGYTARTDDDGRLTFTVAGTELAVDTDRIPAAGPLTPEAVATSGACIALIRWDSRRVPCAAARRRDRGAEEGDPGARGGMGRGTADKAGARAEKAATDAAKVLSERAGRLLRK